MLTNIPVRDTFRALTASCAGLPQPELLRRAVADDLAQAKEDLRSTRLVDTEH